MGTDNLLKFKKITFYWCEKRGDLLQKTGTLLAEKRNI